MSLPLIESVPNVSEGRRREVVASLAAAIRMTADVHLLDYSADASHNRSVFTMAGHATSLEAALLALYEQALPQIDLRTQRGEHPRVGAVDVVPLIPLAGATMAGCVDLARRLGERIAVRFAILVYLYEEAAASPERRRLESIRRGGLDSLAARMALEEWAPDFGPRQPHPTAGVSVVGARLPLIAFNVNLATDDLGVAKQIAATVREANGGLPFVKALGLRLAERGIVQVSMNLTNYERTSMGTAFAAVARSAAQHGVAVLESQIIGLVPEAALHGVAPSDLLLKEFSDAQVLERQLARIR
jgi:glutamate formiminotransferase